MMTKNTQPYSVLIDFPKLFVMNRENFHLYAGGFFRQREARD